MKIFWKVLKSALVISTIVILTLLFVNYKSDLSVESLKLKYANSESEFIDIDGMLVHYRDEGDIADTVPIVLIHGTASSLHTWDECTKVWSENHRVLRFDLPAFGLTGPNADNDYSVEQYVSFVNTFLEKKGVNRCYIAGNSLGGMITWEFALKYPEKVKKIILVDAAGYSFDTSKSGTLAFKIGKIPVLKNLLKYLMLRSVVEKSVKTAYFDESKVTDKIVDRYMDFALREGNRKALVARLNQNYVLGHYQATHSQPIYVSVDASKENFVTINNNILLPLKQNYEALSDLLIERIAADLRQVIK